MELEVETCVVRVAEELKIEMVRDVAVDEDDMVRGVAVVEVSEDDIVGSVVVVRVGVAVVAAVEDNVRDVAVAEVDEVLGRISTMASGCEPVVNTASTSIGVFSIVVTVGVVSMGVTDTVAKEMPPETAELVDEYETAHVSGL